jgi:4-hydroxybenzoate polyprenyltransferase
LGDPYSSLEERWMLAVPIGVMTFTVYMPIRRSPWMYLPGLACFATAFSENPFSDIFSCQLALLCTAACGLLYLGYYPGPWNPLPISFSRLLILKNVSIALAWTLASLFVVTPLPPLGWALHRFLFVFGLSLAADLRDTKRDQVMGIDTIASQLGHNKTKWLAAVMVFAAGFTLLTLEEPLPPGLLWTCMASFSCGTILLCLRQDIPEQRFGPLIDGMMAITAIGTMLLTLN